jgi:adenosine deaminase
MSQDDDALADWLRNLPKAELHLHLEGAIPHDALWRIMGKYGGDPSVPDMAALREKFEYKDFAQFIETWVWKSDFLREYEDFAFFSEAVARDLKSQNVRYAETHYSPSGYGYLGLEVQRITEAVRKGLDRVPGIEIKLIADLIRDMGPESAVSTVHLVSEQKDLGVVGIGLGGSEQKFPPEPFKKAYDLARSKGLHTTAHAGEAAGPESVWGALRDLGVERIGHGVRSVEDGRLVEYVARELIPLEVCPLSNVRTGVVPSIEAHPVRRLFELGCLVTVSTDDPKMFGNSLEQEYHALVTRLGFSREDVKTVILNGISASWLEPEAREKLRAEFVSDAAWA